MNCIGGTTRRVLVPVIVFFFVSLSFLIWWPPALVGKHLSFVTEITEQSPRTTPTSCARVPHQCLQEEAARVKSPIQSAHAPVSRPSVSCVPNFGCEPAVAAVPHGHRMVREKVPGELVRLCIYSSYYCSSFDAP